MNIINAYSMFEIRVVNGGFSSIKCVLTEFITPNMSLICITHAMMQRLKPGFQSKITHEFVLACCEFTDIL